MAALLPCQSLDPEVFFPDGHMSDPSGTLSTAQQACARCHRSQACLLIGEQTKSDGVRGGVLLECGLPRSLRKVGRPRNAA